MQYCKLTSTKQKAKHKTKTQTADRSALKCPCTDIPFPVMYHTEERKRKTQPSRIEGGREGGWVGGGREGGGGRGREGREGEGGEGGGRVGGWVGQSVGAFLFTSIQCKGAGCTSFTKFIPEPEP